MRKGKSRVISVWAVMIIALVAVGGGSSALLAGASVSSPPSLTVSPSTGLVDLQTVTVTGTGFAANVGIGIAQCAPDSTSANQCDLSTVTYTTSDSNGDFSVSRPVRRIINPPGGSVDCASASGCELGAANTADYSDSAFMTISFDSAVPPVVPSVTVSPAEMLVDHQLVTIDGSGFGPQSSVYASECVASTDACAGTINQSTTVGADDTFEVKNFPVLRVLENFGPTGPTPVDCATAPGTCVISVTGGFGSNPNVTAPLAFDPTVGSVEATLSISPSLGVVDHHLVTATGADFLPGTTVTLTECVAGPNSNQICDYSTTRNVTAGFGGQFKTQLVVHRVISNSAFNGPGTSPTPTVDCAQAVGSCLIQAVAYNGVQTTNVDVLLGFDTASVPPPDLSASPTQGLNDDQPIAVHGTQFDPYSPVTVEECSSEAVQAGNLAAYCDGTTAVLTTSDGTGNFETNVFVHGQIVDSEGLVSCAGSGSCVVVAISSNSYIGIGYAGIGYAGIGYAGIGYVASSAKSSGTPSAPSNQGFSLGPVGHSGPAGFSPNQATSDTAGGVPFVVLGFLAGAT